MRLIGLLLVILAVGCALLPVFRESIPFRIALSNHDAIGGLVVCGLAGIVALAGSWL